MHKAAIGIIGASGYSGLEATRILALHPEVELRWLASDRWQGDRVSRRAGVGGAAGELRYLGLEEAGEHLAGCDAVFLATPAEGSLELVPRVLAAGARVIDLSGAFRLKDSAAFARYYGLDHAHPELLAGAVYGLPELFRAELRQARLIANPGCYPTAAALGLAPLFRAGLLEAGPLIVNAASGVTGAGRKASEDFSFAEVDGDFRAYRVLKHQHTPEISQTLSRCAGAPVTVTFIPHLLPVRRGILSTAYARLKPGASGAAVAAALADAYRAEPFVSVASRPEEVCLKAVVGTNRCLLSAACDEDSGQVVVISAIDNLVKGAAGQAVQNLNLVMGWEETTGLTHLQGSHP